VKFLDNPTKTAKRHPEVRDLAKVLKHRGPEFRDLGAVFSRPGGRSALVTINEDFVETMAMVARQAEPPNHSYQGLQVLSPILRVGRASTKSKFDSARILLDGLAVEIPLTPDVIVAAYDAAKDRAHHIVDVMAAYKKYPNGQSEFDAHASRIVDVGRAVRPISGSTLLSILGEHAPSLRHSVDVDYSEEM
jgi:hypothetical protein